MRALTFKLSGKTAFFKKPDVNSFAYFTYGHIHRVALLGLLGAIVGLGGNIQQKDKQYPEYYERLKELKLSVVPLPIDKKGYFSKKLQVYNNSVGYASKEEGGNLIVREQWLEEPKWQIFILDDDSIERSLFEKLCDYIISSKCVYVPYLGKNDHPATITNVSLVELSEIKQQNHIDSLFVMKSYNIRKYSWNDSPEYMYREVVPIALNKDYNFYEYDEICFTNIEVENLDKAKDTYCYEDLVLAFH
ncbi:MAG: type I-B CRISPR-associated protein Cas5b [Bacillota bacterium]